MGSGDLNMKKSWHPQRSGNVAATQKAEAEAIAERKKVQQRLQEIDEERRKEEIQKALEAAGGKRRIDRVEWMYSGPTDGQGSDAAGNEAYLLGKRRIDQLLQDNEAKKLAKQPSQDAIGAIPPINNPRDIATKIREDPLLAIKRQEQQAYEAMMNDPIKRRQLLASMGIEDPQVKKREEERRDRHRHHHRSDRQHRDDRDGDRRSRRHRSDPKDRSRSLSRSWSRSPRRYRSSRSPRRNRDRERNRSATPRRDRSRSPGRSTADDDSKRRRRDSPQGKRYRAPSQDGQGKRGGRESPHGKRHRSSSPGDRARRSRRDSPQGTRYRSSSPTGPGMRDGKDSPQRKRYKSASPDDRNRRAKRGGRSELGDGRSKRRDTAVKESLSPPPVRRRRDRSAEGDQRPRRPYGTRNNDHNRGSQQPRGGYSRDERSIQASQGPDQEQRERERAQKLAAMQEAATDLDKDRERRLAAIEAVERAQQETDDRVRQQNKRLGGSAGFTSSLHSRAADMKVADRVRAR